MGLLIQELSSSYVEDNIVTVQRASGYSMEDTILDNDVILVDVMAVHDLEHGDIVFMEMQGSSLVVKRCIGLPGDTIQIRNKQVTINGAKESMLETIKHSDPNIIPFSVDSAERYGSRDNIEPVIVPDGHIFVLGDNRDDSYDSRFFGSVSNEDIMGKALYVFWSFKMKPENNENTFLILYSLFFKPRWSRIGTAL